MKKMDSGEFATKYTEMMTKNCSLTPEQIKKVEKLNVGYAQKCCTDSKVDFEKYNEERDTELKKILDKDQYSKWELNKKKWTDAIKEGWEEFKEDVKDFKEDVKDVVKDVKKKI